MHIVPSRVVFPLCFVFYSLGYVQRSENYWLKVYINCQTAFQKKKIYVLTSGGLEYTVGEFWTSVGT